MGIAKGFPFTLIRPRYSRLLLRVVQVEVLAVLEEEALVEVVVKAPIVHPVVEVLVIRT